MIASRTVRLTALFVFLTACESGAPDPGLVEVYDSAGVQIVHSALPQWQAGDQLALAPAPAVSIGALDGPHEQLLFRVTGAARLRDGRIVVANGGSHELRFYGSDGSYLGAAGGFGDGPGEFRQMTSLATIADDSLVVYDWRLLRVSIFDSSGRFARSFTPARYEDQPSPLVMGVFGDGSLLMRAGGVIRASDERRGVIRDSIALYTVDREGTFLRAFGRHPGMESFMPPRESGVIVMGLPFGREFWTAAGRDEIFIGSSGGYELETYSVTGELKRIIRRAHEPLRVTGDLVNGFVQQTLERTSDEAFRRRLQDLYRTLPYPETLPAHAELRADAAGRLWVRDYQPVGSPESYWSLFALDGRWLGTVQLPAEFSVLQLGEDYVLGRRTDDLGIERVEMFRLKRPV